MRKTGTLGLVLVLTLGLLLLATAAAFADDDRKLETRLTGAAEVPGPGDPDGKGEAKIKFKKNFRQLCFELEVARIAPATAAHVHVAPAGVAGPIVAPLTPPTNGESEGCVDIDRALGRAIAQHPEEYYVNVHNADFPAGALRGQLHKDD